MSDAQDTCPMDMSPIAKAWQQNPPPEVPMDSQPPKRFARPVSSVEIFADPSASLHDSGPEAKTSIGEEEKGKDGCPSQDPPKSTPPPASATDLFHANEMVTRQEQFAEKEALEKENRKKKASEGDNPEEGPLNRAQKRTQKRKEESAQKKEEKERAKAQKAAEKAAKKATEKAKANMQKKKKQQRRNPRRKLLQRNLARVGQSARQRIKTRLIRIWLRPLRYLLLLLPRTFPWNVLTSLQQTGPAALQLLLGMLRRQGESLGLAATGPQIMGKVTDGMLSRMSSPSSFRAD